MERLTYTVSEVAERLGISRSSAYDRVRRGEIPAITLGRRLVVSRTVLEQLIGAATTSRRAVRPGRATDRPGRPRLLIAPHGNPPRFLWTFWDGFQTLCSADLPTRRSNR